VAWLNISSIFELDTYFEPGNCTFISISMMGCSTEDELLSIVDKTSSFLNYQIIRREAKEVNMYCLFKSIQ